MNYYKYSFKCKKCGLVLYAPNLSGDYIDECYNCIQGVNVITEGK